MVAAAFRSANAGRRVLTPSLPIWGQGQLQGIAWTELTMTAHTRQKIAVGPPYKINPGDRIAQALILPVEQVAFEWADELSDTQRGAGGFGHTGSK